METTPACRECKRSTKSRGPNKGEPIHLLYEGPNAGLCKSCQRREQPAYRSALEYWLNTVYRSRRRVNDSLSH